MPDSSAAARTRSVRSLISLTMPRGWMPCSSLCAVWIARRRYVSSIARCIDRVIVVGVHDDLAVDMARGAADRLDQRALGAQVALLVGVQDRDQRNLGQVQTLAQEVDADDHVVDAEAQVAQDLDPLEACRSRCAGSGCGRPSP